MNPITVVAIPKRREEPPCPASVPSGPVVPSGEEAAWEADLMAFLAADPLAPPRAFQVAP